jgi:hypothetical protein
MAKMRSMTKNLNTKMWGLPIIAEPPTGEILTVDVATGLQLHCVQYHGITARLDPDSGEDIMVQEPTMTVHVDSFATAPKAGEKWFFKVPTYPGSLELKRYRMSHDNFKRDEMLGTITMALIEIKATA